MHIEEKQREHVPNVDVIIAVWNREATIVSAISSALADSAINHVFVIDDASEDNTVASARGCDDGSGRVIIRELNNNIGPSAARNIALDLSSASWVTVLDADDFFLPGRISKLLAWCSDCDFVADDILRIAEDRVEKGHYDPLISSQPFTPWLCDLETFVRGNIGKPGKARKELGFLKPIMRRNFLVGHNLRYDENLRLGEDYAFYAKALAHNAKFLVVPAQGYVSLVRPGSLSGRHTKKDLERLRDSDRALVKMRVFSVAETRAIQKHYRATDAKVQWLEVIDAVKRRRLLPFFSAFLRSPEVSFFLAARLWEQLVLRTKRVRDRRREGRHFHEDT